MSPLVLFSQITRKLSTLYPNLDKSSLLSAPSLEYKGRAFACCKDGLLTIKISNKQQLENLGVRSNHSNGVFFSRQNGKWVQIPYYYHMDWETLTELALEDAVAEFG
jgi:hypothetical protein